MNNMFIHVPVRYIFGTICFVSFGVWNGMGKWYTVVCPLRNYPTGYTLSIGGPSDGQDSLWSCSPWSCCNKETPANDLYHLLIAHWDWEQFLHERPAMELRRLMQMLEELTNLTQHGYCKFPTNLQQYFLLLCWSVKNFATTNELYLSNKMQTQML